LRKNKIDEKLSGKQKNLVPIIYAHQLFQLPEDRLDVNEEQTSHRVQVTAVVQLVFQGSNWA
jgi:hypothetical protein